MKKNEIKVEEKEVKKQAEVLVEEKRNETAVSERDELELVYKFMKDNGINSISDIENKIARL